WGRIHFLPEPAMKRSPAHIVREYGPFAGVEQVHGLTYDGRHVWFAVGDSLAALEPDSGEVVRRIDVPAQAGTAFDGRHLFQIAGVVLEMSDRASGRVLGAIPAPPGACNSALAWPEGMLWEGQYQPRQILQLDPATGAVLRTLHSDR